MAPTTRILLVSALLAGCGEPDGVREAEQPLPVSQSEGKQVSPPTVSNRDDVLEYRNEAARMLLPPGDSVTVYVFARIDEQGVPHQAEVKQEIDDERIKGAAISVVQKMQFNPARENGQPTSVLLKIPVRFVHEPGP